MGFMYTPNPAPFIVTTAIGYEDYYMCMVSDPGFIHEFQKVVNEQTDAGVARLANQQAGRWTYQELHDSRLLSGLKVLPHGIEGLERGAKIVRIDLAAVECA